ncbi:MAG: hypothetical protein HY347_06560 [candidate division NC10 bacterium]|nr:hypothetical protein [candidate division NC10 bacterium]
MVKRATGAVKATWRVVPLVVLLGLVGSGGVALSSEGKPISTAEVESAFKEAVRLWADERFETLWEQGLLRSRYLFPKEEFIFKMRNRALRPACCWRQVQEVTVHLRSAGDALIEAKMGFDSRSRGNSFDTTLTFYLRWEEGEWRAALEDFLFKPDETLHRIFLPPRSRRKLMILEPRGRSITLQPRRGAPLSHQPCE